MTPASGHTLWTVARVGYGGGVLALWALVAWESGRERAWDDVLYGCLLALGWPLAAVGWLAYGVVVVLRRARRTRGTARGRAPARVRDEQPDARDARW